MIIHELTFARWPVCPRGVQRGDAWERIGFANVNHQPHSKYWVFHRMLLYDLSKHSSKSPELNKFPSRATIWLGGTSNCHILTMRSHLSCSESYTSAEHRSNVCHGTHVLLSQQIPHPHGSFLAMSPQHICTLLCSCQAMLSTLQVPRHTPQPTKSHVDKPTNLSHRPQADERVTILQWCIYINLG